MNYYDYLNATNDGTVAMDVLGGERTSQISTPGDAINSAKTKSLEEHDKRFHPNGWKQGDDCKFREGLEAYGDKDDLGEVLKGTGKKDSYYLTPVHSSARLVKKISPFGNDDIAFGGRKVARAILPQNTDPNKRLEAMYALAEANVGTLNTIIDRTGNEAGCDILKRPPNDAYKGLPIKTWLRAKQKADTWYRNKEGNFGDYQQLNDLIGATLILKDDDSFADVIEHLDSNIRKFGAQIAQVNPYNLTTGKPGYRDLKVTVRFQNGGLGEVILIEDFMNRQKNTNYGHAAYEAFRTFNGMLQCGDKSVLGLMNEMNDMMKMLYERDASKIDDAKFAKQKKTIGDSFKKILANPDSFMPTIPDDYRREITDEAKRRQFFEQERTDNLKALESVMNPDRNDPSGRSKWDKMKLADPEDRIDLSRQNQPSQWPLTSREPV